MDDHGLQAQPKRPAPIDSDTLQPTAKRQRSDVDPTLDQSPIETIESSNPPLSPSSDPDDFFDEVDFDPYTGLPRKKGPKPKTTEVSTHAVGYFLFETARIYANKKSH